MEIKFDSKKLKQRLNKIFKRTQDLSKPLQIISVDIKNETLRNFDEKHSFDGNAWKQSKRAAEQGGETLKDTGRLYRSFKNKAGRNYARVGTNVKYARLLNQGAKKGEFGEITVNVKSFKRKIYRKTKSGRKSKRASRTIVKAHSRKIKVPWGDIPGYRFLGLSKEAKERYTKELLEYILKK